MAYCPKPEYLCRTNGDSVFQYSTVLILDNVNFHVDTRSLSGNNSRSSRKNPTTLPIYRSQVTWNCKTKLSLFPGHRNVHHSLGRRRQHVILPQARRSLC